MELKTKFNIGDKVWFCNSDFKAIEATITKIHIYVTKKEIEESYGVMYDTKPLDFPPITLLDVTELASTKEELKENLIKNL